MQEAADTAGHPHAAARQDPQEPAGRALADRPRRDRHLLRQARRGRGVRRGRVHRHPVPYPISPVNAPRVLALLERTDLSFIVDHLDVARGVVGRNDAPPGARSTSSSRWTSASTAAASIPIRDTAVPFITTVAALPGLRLRGLLSHAGHAYHADVGRTSCERSPRDEARTLRELADVGAQASSVEIEELSAGATPTARFSLAQEGLTEYRAGNYVYFDRTQVGLGAASLDDCALTVLATVVSKPAADRIILDCGSKTLAADGARGFSPLSGPRRVCADRCDATRVTRPDEDLIVERLSEEHATVRVAAGGTRHSNPATACGSCPTIRVWCRIWWIKRG